MKKLASLAVTAFAFTGLMQATVLTTASPTGLGTVGITPAFTLNFDNTPGLTTNSTITNQYAFAGVTFSSPAFYDGNSAGGGCNFSNESGDCISNFTSASGQGLISGPVNPFSILFATPQSYAAFALVTGANGNNNTIITAYRNGSSVDSSPITTSTSNPINYVGFYNETTPFDTITITTSGGMQIQNLIIIDNLQISAVPEPATVGMFALGLGSVVAFARRRRKA